ncbi:hypothetical protein [Kiloniella laminariae]|uniref:hypothetical protein n=1 Tax=Kiloniella laminariae TaxID=454162 RepID=UPI00039B0193|nr:hypothetical protein [Kiloniella laminariae]
MPNLKTAAFFASVILLSGCAFGGNGQKETPVEKTTAPATSSSTLALPPSDTGGAVNNSAVSGTVSNTPDGLTISDQPAAENNPYGSSNPSVLIEGSDGQLYSATEPKSEEEYQSDVASCHYYAEALIAHDARVEDDRGGSFNDSLGGGGSSLFKLRSSIDTQEPKQRQAVHFSRCMRSKGYYQR